ncbi:two-partner secretion domain-containing protein [Oxalicibacterium solurbis]|uniref:Filamentous haemagglutinin FhaB/tRNA nuclease CdiA-like TPS domain-containing protein n=1 Tax=Oxalicibacterium solurbis TaxID=69280 RepID=A0A8J3B4L6_9BURK|nr:hemagglutinin repeat-containing protein [Oxalicibacterium solurbis]GGI54704.1 hypothetical protein GCM10011430_18780 [Oxalicibacterium solurbis]
MKKQSNLDIDSMESNVVCATRRPWVSLVAKAVTFLYLAQIIGPVASAFAQVVAYKNAPAGRRPIMDAANNGVPIVNIAPPSAGGVSRNQYQDFNVAPKGLILNNSRNNSKTQLGGWVAGNPQMGATPARVILNEVVSGNPSRLRGTIEVAGQKAAIVVANPNGVSCDGCGFLNTDRATLAAGAPRFGSNGALTGFNVGQGQLNIGTQGLNAANIEQLDLIARGIVIEGEIWSRNLNVIAGRNEVLYGTLQAIAKNGSDSAPEFAIDIKELGGMYANQIYMVATEQGLGVNSTGRIAALQGNLTLATNGDLALTDGYAKQNLQLAASGNIVLKDKAIGDSAVRIASLGNLDNLGIVFSGGDIEMKAAAINDNKGKLMAAGDLSMHAHAISLNETTLTADGNAMLSASTDDVQADKSTLYAGGNLGIAAAERIVNADGVWQARGNVSLQTKSIDNRASSILANQALNMTTSSDGLLDNQAGTLVGNVAVALNGSEIRNAQGTIATDGILYIDTKNAQLDNTDGNIQAGADATVSVAALDNTNGTLASSGNMALDIDGDYINKGILSSEKDFTVSAKNITNNGTLNASQKMVVNTGDLLNEGEISAGNETTLNLAGALTNTATGLIDGSATTIDANTVDNTGRVYGDLLKIQADTLNNSDTGVIAARENLLVGARNIGNTNGGLIYSLGDIAMAGGFSDENAATGEIETLLNASSKIEAAGNIDIAAKDLINRNDELVTRTVTSSVAINKTQIQRHESSDLTKYNPAQLGWSSKLGRGMGAYVLPSAAYPFATYGTEPKDEAYTRRCRDGDCEYTYRYTNSDPIWALFGVTPGQFALLNNKILAFNANLTARSFDDWREYKWTRKDITDTVVDSTRPAEILAGNGLTIDASNSVLNDNSSMVAGGTINIVGANVENRGTQGTRTERDVGRLRIRYVTRTTNDPELDWYDQGAVTGAPVVTTTTLQAYTYKQNASTPVASRDLTSNAGSTPVAPLPEDAIDQLSGQTQYREWTIPNSSILTAKTAPDAKYLVESDPRFTIKNNFLSSDYYREKLIASPELQLKRYGDGFVEQQLINDQILALTGKRYLSGYTDTESEYKSLMDAGIAFVQQYQISPGVVLSAEQMALLTTDIVMLIKQPVTLADGSVQEVLVPQVYLRRPQEGDLLPSGGLIAGSDVTIKSAHDIVNSGQISADNETTLVAGNDLTNRDGRISGQDVYARANNDFKNISGTIIGTGEDSQVALSAGRDIVLETRTIAGETKRTATTIASKRVNVDRIATVQGGDVTLDAGRDMIGKASAVLADKDLAVVAGRDIKVNALETSYAINDQRGGRVTKGRSAYHKEESVTNELAIFGAGNSVVLAAGTAGKGDIALIGVNAAAGDSIVMQGTNVAIQAVKDSQLDDIQNVSKNRYARYMRSDEKLSGGVISAGNDLIVRATGEAGAADENGIVKPIAGTGNVKLSGAYLQSQNGQVGVVANNNVEIGAIKTEHATAYEYYKKSKSMFSTKVVTISDLATREQVEGSVVSGKSVAVQAGNLIDMTGDVLVKASQIVADNDLQITAGRNLTIGADQQQSKSYYFYEKKKSGMFSGGGFGVTIGSQKLTQKQWVTKETNVGSTVGSVGGNVDLSAGKQYTQTASQVSSPDGDVNIIAQKVDINAVADSQLARSEQRFKQSGLTVAISSPVISAIQTVQQMAQAAGQTSDGRMQALAGATSALAINDAYGAIQRGQGVDVGDKTNQIITSRDANGNVTGSRDANAADKVGGINVSISYGSSKSESKSTQASSTAVGSAIAAGGDVTIVAAGAGKDSDITVHGSNITAGNNLAMLAEDEIKLIAARNTAEQHSSNKSSSGSLGVSIGTSGFGVTASASSGRGKADGSDVGWTNTHVTAGDQVAMQSGGNTTIKGAAVSGNQVIANVGGDLNIESLQDTSQYDSKQKNIGGSITVGASVSGSISYSKSNVNSDYASVTEQSGIKAGDDGFQVNVDGNTDLKGAVIASTDKAVEDGKNSLVTASLTMSDIQNKAEYEGESMGLNLGSSVSLDGKLAPSGTSLGYGSDSDNASSVTQSGVSGIAGNKDVRTGDKETGIQKIFDAERVQHEIDAQMKITQAFGREAPKAAANFAASQMQGLKDQAMAAVQAGDESKAAQLLAEVGKWDEGGAYRIALHTALGGFAGGVDGALGASAAASAAPLLNQLQDGVLTALKDAGIGETVAKAAAQLIAQGTAASVGAVVSGGNVAGAGMAFNTDTNNRQLHPEEKTLAQKLAKLSGGKYTAEQIEEQMRSMDVVINGEVEPGIVDVVLDGKPLDEGSTWVPGGGTVVVQSLADMNPELRAFIVQNTTGEGIPGTITYAGPFDAPSVPKVINTPPIQTAACPYGAFDCAAGIPVDNLVQRRNNAADFASWLSTQSGRFSSLSTAYGAYLSMNPNPVSQAGAATQYGMAGIAEIVEFSAGALEQFLRPNIGATTVNSLTDLAAKPMMDRYPLGAPFTNEVLEMWKNSSTAQEMQNKINGKE